MRCLSESGGDMDRVVVYAGTKNIYDQMYVALKSLLANNLIDRVYLLLETDTFSYFLPENVHIINVSNQDYFHAGSANFNSPWSYMAMMKCVLSDIFPKEQKILWLDCDTIVNADISELFDLDMGEYLYAGTVEPKKSHWKFKYINTGVLLVNLKMLQMNRKEQEMVMYLNRYTFNFPDQDVINLLCQGKILEIDSEWNNNAYTYRCTHPKIVHFAAMKNYRIHPVYRKYESMFLTKGDVNNGRKADE